ncbi:MAG TPA: preprotein translocase subunit YajC [Bacteroidia bacterium]|nr:preprotein translocase subunit YajC [Bacteroidia bacterium]
MSISTLLLQAATEGAKPDGAFGPGTMNIIMIVLIIVVFYFFMIRPQQRKQKEIASYINEIGKGSKVVTIGGIIGKVQEVRNKTFLIEVEGGNRLQVLKSGISLENSKAYNSESTDVKIEEPKQ